MLSRRTLLQLLAAAPLQAADSQMHVPVRAITRGPGYHWFGYYDKLELDPSGRYVLGNHVAFEGRTPAPDDVIQVGMIDLQNDDRWVPFGDSRAWSWQQACMLQWIAGSSSLVIWNDRQGDQFVSHIYDTTKRQRVRTLPAPVHCLSPDGRYALHEDFRRLHDLRPGYGYAGPVDPYRAQEAPAEIGLWKLDLQSGKETLLLSLADAKRIPNPHTDWTGAKHWFNHVLFSPDGRRYIVLHRWEIKQSPGFGTRMLTGSVDGGDLRVVDPYGKTSHFIWRDNRHILAWAYHPSKGEKFYLYTDGSDEVQVIGPDVMTVNGHCTYLPGGRYILNDTYPDSQRQQHLYLFEIATGKRTALADLVSPPTYQSEFRCDLHPRYSRDGRKVVIDSTHGGNGRQMYLVDLTQQMKNQG